MRFNIRNTLFVILLLVQTRAFGQEEKSEPEPVRKNRITLSIGHMNLAQGVDVNGNKSWLSVPVWMLDYDRSISKKWTIGLHTDFITESFKVEGFFYSDEKAPIERSMPVSSVVSFSYKPGKHTVFSVGNGGEFSKEANFFVTQFGFEYGIELPGEWELAPSLTYDMKWTAYDSFSIALGVGKKF